MKIAAFAGGVGGAKLADGLVQNLPPEDLTVIVNIGDDFEHFGLKVCPDLDTVCYTLAGIANPETGWGRVGERWEAMESAERLGAPSWFRAAACWRCAQPDHAGSLRRLGRGPNGPAGQR
jgi:LPPG:FO 2-phospho-L-lactate transferase